MKLLFDLRATQSAVNGAEGGGEYSRAIFRRLVAVDSEQRVAGFYKPEFLLDQEIADLIERHQIETYPVRNEKEIQALVSSGRFSCFMSGLPYYCHRLDFGNMEVFLTVHGLRPLEQRIPFHARHYAHGLAGKMKWLAKYVLELTWPSWRQRQFQGLVDVPCGQLHLMVPSWHTRYSMIEKLTINPRVQIHSFYSPETAVCQIAQPKMEIMTKLGVEEGRYFFMVSGNRWIKNSWRGLTAFIEVMDKMPDDQWLPVVITGGVPSGLPSGRRPYIIPTGYLSTDELAAMYRGARALIYPTLNEGFGYPPLEAMAQGTPVICSAISSVTEIVGQAAIYFSPTEMDELKIRLRLALEDDKILAEYAQRGVQRVAEVRQRQSDDADQLCAMLLAAAGG